MSSRPLVDLTVTLANGETYAWTARQPSALKWFLMQLVAKFEGAAWRMERAS